MTTISLELNIPADFFTTQQQSPHDLTQHLKKWIAVLLFREYQLSIQQAAELAGLPLNDFIALVGQPAPLLPDSNPLLQLIGIANGSPLTETLDEEVYNLEKL